jgi:hypothetical protein
MISLKYNSKYFDTIVPKSNGIEFHYQGKKVINEIQDFETIVNVDLKPVMIKLISDISIVFYVIDFFEYKLNGYDGMPEIRLNAYHLFDDTKSIKVSLNVGNIDTIIFEEIK